MKKAILIVLIVAMSSNLCLAEVEPDGLFSIEGTLWGMCGIGFVSIPPFIGINCGAELGFYQGKVYACTNNNCAPAPDQAISSYNDLIVVSIVYVIQFPDEGDWIENEWGFLFAIMQPIGLGMYTTIAYTPGGGGWIPIPQMLGYTTGIMYKINDNWTPPSD